MTSRTAKPRPARPATPDDVFLFRSTSDPQLSPDGQRVAWTIINQDRESDRPQTRIQVGSTTGSDPRDFTCGPADSSPRWSPAGEHLALLRAVEDKAPQVYLAALSGGEPQRLTDLPGGVSAIAWSPDGSQIALVSRTGTPKPAAERTPAERNAPRVVTRLNGRLDGQGWYEGRAHLCVLDVASGSVRQLTDGDWDDAQPSWSPDGKTILFVSDRTRRRHVTVFRCEVYSVPAAGGKATRLTQQGGGATFPRFSPDGKWIAYAGDDAGDGFWNEQSSLWVLPADGSAAPCRLAADLDCPIGSALDRIPALAWLPDSRRLLALSEHRGTYRLVLVDLEGAKTAVAVGGDRTVDSFSLGPDGKTFVYSTSWFGSPHEIELATLGSKSAARVVSNANEAARTELLLPSAKRITHTTADGLEIEAFLCLPSKPSRKLPLVMDIHGGPHAAHPLPTAQLNSAILTAAGYAVVFPNPRGSSGYGRDFMRANHQDWGGGDYEDLMGCVDALIADGTADPDRLYVQGYSYGGYMSAWIIGQTDRFRAACVGAPVVDLVSMEGTSDVPGFMTHEFMGPAWEAPQLLRERSPITHLSRVKTPTMINHWEGDLRCPIGQADQLFHALLTQGVDTVMVRYPGGAHGLRTPSQMVDRFERILSWYDEH